MIVDIIELNSISDVPLNLNQKDFLRKKKLVKLLYEEFLSLMNCQVNGKSSLMKGLAEKPYLNK